MTKYFIKQNNDLCNNLYLINRKDNSWGNKEYATLFSFDEAEKIRNEYDEKNDIEIIKK